MTTQEEFLGGGSKSAKFPTVGTKVGGVIVGEPEVKQQRDFDTDELAFWPDGKPKYQLVVRIQTDKQEDGEDDGVRAFYIKGGMQSAVRDAVRKAGVKGLKEGGELTITYAGDGEAKKRGYNPPKLYTATYTAPEAGAAFLASDPEPAAAAPAGDALPNPKYDKVATDALRASGMSDEQITKL